MGNFTVEKQFDYDIQNVTVSGRAPNARPRYDIWSNSSAPANFLGNVECDVEGELPEQDVIDSIQEAAMMKKGEI